MIAANGHLHCDNCGKEHALKLNGQLEWYCPRCKCYNKSEGLRENTYLLKGLDNTNIPVVNLKVKP